MSENKPETIKKIEDEIFDDEKLVKIKRQRDELLQATELIITENIPIINAGEESNGVARLDKVVEKIKREVANDE
jgi:hypothetical protein